MKRQELTLGLIFLAHCEQQVGVFAAQFEVIGIELEGLFKFVDVRITLGQKLASLLGYAGRLSARRRQQQKVCFFGTAK